MANCSCVPGSTADISTESDVKREMTAANGEVSGRFSNLASDDSLVYVCAIAIARSNSGVASLRAATSIMTRRAFDTEPIEKRRNKVTERDVRFRARSYAPLQDEQADKASPGPADEVTRSL
jgi:hypothetical protein